jgi:hypothetical protein
VIQSKIRAKLGQKKARKTHHDRLVHSATKLQSVARATLVRAAVVNRLSAAGQMLAMPGTTHGSSGWYEMRRDRERFVTQFDVDADENWSVITPPMSFLSWREMQRGGEMLAKEKEDGALNVDIEATDGDQSVPLQAPQLRSRGVSIEELVDPESNRTYYRDSETGRTAVTIEQLLPVTPRGPMTFPTETEKANEKEEVALGFEVEESLGGDQSIPLQAPQLKAPEVEAPSPLLKVQNFEEHARQEKEERRKAEEQARKQEQEQEAKQNSALEQQQRREKRIRQAREQNTDRTNRDLETQRQFAKQYSSTCIQSQVRANQGRSTVTRKGIEKADKLNGKFATRIQAWARVDIARAKVVTEMQKTGTLLAMPGTIQGCSGWYEMNRNGVRMVAKFQVKADGSWKVERLPVKRATWAVDRVTSATRRGVVKEVDKI